LRVDQRNAYQTLYPKWRRKDFDLSMPSKSMSIGKIQNTQEIAAEKITACFFRGKHY
jgi:hypothetical protein